MGIRDNDYGEWPAQEVDHTHGDPGNNRLNNLRLATHQQNSYNAKLRSNSRSERKGKELHATVQEVRLSVADGAHLLTVGVYPTVDGEDPARDPIKLEFGQLNRFKRPILKHVLHLHHSLGLRATLP